MSSQYEPKKKGGLLAIIILLTFLASVLFGRFVWNPFDHSASQTAQVEAPTLPPLPATEPVEILYTVKRGDTLIGLFGKKNWQQVCQFNQLKNCHKLKIGLTLRLPAGVEVIKKPVAVITQAKQVTALAPKSILVTKAVSSAKPKAQQRAAASSTPRVTGNRDSNGYFLWKVVGVRNLRIYQDGRYLRHNQVLAMRAMGATEEEIRQVTAALKNGTAEIDEMQKGMKFSQMTFSTKAGVKAMGKVIYVGDEVHVIYRVRTSSGRVFTIVKKCDNLAVEEAPPPAPPVETLPPPPSIVPPPPSIAPPSEAKKFCHSWRLNAVVGAELELDKALAHSGYGAWGVYCMKLLKDGQIGFGPAGQMAFYGSSPGKGKFNGHLVAAGIGMMRVWDSGQDLEAKLMIGDYRSSYRESDYRSKEHRTVIAISAAHNDYSGRLDGSGRPERQIFGMVGLPIGGSSKHSWQGQDLGDASALQLYANVGVRQYLLKEDPERKLNPYVQVGALGEIRSGEDYFSCSVRLGVTNKRRTIGVHAGVNACDGGIVPAIGAWYDLGTDLRLKRAERRAAALEEDTGEGREATTTFESRSLADTREE